MPQPAPFDISDCFPAEDPNFYLDPTPASLHWSAQTTPGPHLS